MKYTLIKAQAKKNKYLSQLNQRSKKEESDEDMSSDNDENTCSELMGELVNGRYLLIHYLGRGAFSTVWLMYDCVDFSFKVGKHHIEENFSESTMEIKHLIRLMEHTNPNIIHYYEHIYYEKYGNKYMLIVLEPLGVSLLDVMNDLMSIVDDEKENYYEHITMDVLKRIIRHILNGFTTIHKLKLIHADIKPENILLDICPYKIDKLKEYLGELSLKEKYELIYVSLLPQHIDDLDKNKRKMLKRKIRIRATIELKKFILDKITEFNSHYSLDINNDLLDFKYDMNRVLKGDFVCKIIDFGNAENHDDISQGELYMKAYRPPENILFLNYTYKSDIWALGCIFYELITGEMLFDIDSSLPELERDKHHLNQMFKIIGSMDLNMIDNCDFYDDYFDYNGKLKLNKDKLKEKYDSLGTLIDNYSIIKNDSLSDFKLFLKLCFDYNIHVRMDSITLLRHPFLNK